MQTQARSQQRMLAAQREVWTAQQMTPDGSGLNCAGYLDIRGPLDATAFTAAFDRAAAEASNLWCTVDAGPGDPALRSVSPPRLLRRDLKGAVDAERSAINDMAASADVPTDPAEALAAKVVLYRLADDRHFFFTQYHHLLFDGYGQVLLWQRVAELYRAITQGAEPLPSVFAPHAQLVSDEADLDQVFETNAEALSAQMRGRSWSVRLPPGRPTVRRTHRTDALAPTAASDACAERLGVRWSTVITALVACYLRRVSESDDVVMGFPTRGRHTPAQRGTPTMLSNELTLLVEIAVTDTFADVLAQVDQRVGFLLGHQKVRGEEVLRRARRHDAAVRRPNVVLNVMSFSTSVDLGDAVGRIEQLSTGPVRELSADIYRLDDDIRISLATDGSTLGSDDIARHSKRLAHLFASAASLDPSVTVADLDILPAAEREELERFSATDREMPAPRAVTDLITEIAAVRDDATALSGEGGTLTYRQLLDTMQGIAGRLRATGVRPGDVVGVHMSRSTAQVCAALGVMDANAVYLPLDSSGPSARRDHILDDSRPVLLITDESVDFALPDGCTVVRYADLIGAASPSRSEREPISTGAPAYLIYTSGSTGRPKGVLVPHDALWNRLQWMKDDYAVTPHDVYLQKTNPTFDVAMWELLLPLVTGARLHSLRSGQERDPRVLASVIQDEQVSVAHFVPTMLDAFLRDLRLAPASLRLVFASGEVLRSTTVGLHLERLPRCELHNLYGPTEAAIDVTAWRCGTAEVERGVVPIGRPVANTRISVLDDHQRTVPIGVPGELCIRGVQLATGYLNHPELDDERFVHDGDLTERAYRTGDLVRWTEDGVLEYLGRSDDQVKIRGFRVELGEIETQIQRVSGAAGVAVVRGPEGAEDQLIAYVAGSTRPLTSLGECLVAELPDYMIPTWWHVVDAIPQLPNGKRDIRALRDLLSAYSADAAVAATSAPVTVLDTATDIATDTVEAIRLGFVTVLSAATVHATDDFFALGGDSMRAVRLRSLVETATGLTFAIEDLYGSPTPARLALCLQDEGRSQQTAPFELVADEDRAPLPADLDDAYPLTSMQQGILYQYEKDHESTVYRVVTSVTVPYPLNIDRLTASCAHVLARHPQLRTSVDLTSFTEPLQLVHNLVDVVVEEVEDLGGLPAPVVDQRLDSFIDEARRARFDVERGPLIRFASHSLSADAFQLTAVEHHVALDGWSDVLLFEEIVAHYEGRELPPPPRSSYRDYVALERATSADPESQQFWAEQLRGAGLPELFGRRALDAADVRSQVERFPISVPATTAQRLTELGAHHGVSLKTVLVAAHVLAISAASGHAEVVTGVIANARPETRDAENMIGVFLNTLPLRASVADRTIRDLLLCLQDWEVAAAPHRFYPFGLIERELRDEIRLGDLPVYINFMDFRRSDYGGSAAALRGVRAVADTNYPAAVDFMLSDETAGIIAWIDGNLGVFTEDELTRLASLHERAIEALATSDDDTVVQSIELLGDDEVTEVSGPELGLPQTTNVLRSIREQARLNPQARAVSHRDQTWTYADVMAWAGGYEVVLRTRGVRPGDPVAIHMERGPHMVAAILGVLGAGGHYVPLDPTYPHPRLAAIVADAAPRVTLTDNPGSLGFLHERLTLRPREVERGVVGSHPTREPSASDLAYVIYTSGSTGKPKGVAITHRNLANFMRAMDIAVGCDRDDVMLAATSLSFDISMLELLWPLCAGSHVVVADSSIAQHVTTDESDLTRRKPLEASLFFFAAGASTSEDASEGYRLLLDAARFADTHDFTAVWTPERHFHDFGGLYPNPALTSAALATVTSRVQLRCGSVVAPLHDPLRLAEEWAVVDQLSGGRVGLAFASGWNSIDFALSPTSFADRKAMLAKLIDEFTCLWQRKPLERTGGSGEPVRLTTYPSPVQSLPPMWLTSVGTPATFIDAGRRGFNVLTHLFGQDLDALSQHVAAYREARAAAGHDGEGTVTLMLHTFVHDDDEQAMATAKEPFKAYLRRSTELWRAMFAATGQEFPEEDAEEYLDAVLDVAVDRYFEVAGLFGSPSSKTDLLHSIRDAGVDEVAALIDFGVPNDEVMSGLGRLADLFARHRGEVERSGHSLTELCRRHGVTMFQATPSVMSTIVRDEEGMAAMGNLRALLVGGEQFPLGLARELVEGLPRTRIFNMYGPTETTIWSTVEEMRRVADASVVPVGRPIANTTVTVLDPLGRSVPTGVSGELWIAGEGVSPGYLRRPDLTADRFRDRGGRLFYGTGDLARLTREGKVHVLGRIDRQVKIHGQRVELDEIEGTISQHPAIAEAAVVTRGSELVAYLLPSDDRGEYFETTLDSWSTLWDGAYADQRDNPYAGWTSTYTGRPIPSVEMDEWTRATVAAITDLPHRQVLEIGMGTGLIRRGLGSAPDYYLGIDTSEQAIAQAKNVDIPGVATDFRVGELWVLDGHDRRFDLVVVNSVAQYFPSSAYLASVLDRALELIEEDGAVFVGDVRSFGDLADFYLDVELERGSPLDTVGDLRGRVDQRRMREAELCVTPEFFHSWAASQEGIQADVTVKRTDTRNEMSSFRYDVVLRRSPVVTEPDAGEVVWEDLASVQAALCSTPYSVTVPDVPNHKLTRPHQLAAGIKSMAPGESVWDLERAVWSRLWHGGPTYAELEELARQQGRRVDVRPHGDSLSTLDVHFSPRGGH